MERGEVTLEVGNDGVAIIQISNPPVNLLSAHINSSIKEKLNEATSRDNVKAIVLTGKGGKFSGGFDINRFKKASNTGESWPSVTLYTVVNMIEGLKKPVVAAIERFAFGGGLELAMGCHARIATPRAQLGSPELTFGIILGAGGTQTLPRLVGLSKAIEMIMSSKPILSEEGKKLGLIDSVVSSEELMEVSRQWALGIAERCKPWLCSFERTDIIGSLSEARKILKVARQQASKMSPNMPQYQLCLNAVEEGIVHGARNGLIKEAKIFRELVSSETTRALVHVFFARHATSKVPNVTDMGLTPRSIKKVGVVGGGLMGSGIATTLILGNINVVLKEVNSEYLLEGTKSIEANVHGLVATGKLTQDKARKALSLLKGVSDYTDFKDVAMVIEAVVENIPLKQQIFSEIEKACSSHCILASNTSYVDLRVIGEKTSSQNRIVGAHFFSPAHLMPLLEIVRTETTLPQVIFDVLTLCKIINKVPVVVGNCAGFAVNRVFFPYTRGAHRLAHLGVDVFRIDRVIKKFGFPIGPFQLQDLIGYGLILSASKVLSNLIPDQMFRSPLVELLVKSGRNGKINGKGYYLYEKGGAPKPDPTIQPILEESRRLANIMPGGKPISVTDQEILEMILFPVVNEACCVMEEGIVVRASDLDIASVLGMSFPSYRGGIVYWANTVGAKNVYLSLKKWCEIYGKFYEPSKFLEERATKGMLLSEPASSSSPRFSRPRL